MFHNYYYFVVVEKLCPDMSAYNNFSLGSDFIHGKWHRSRGQDEYFVLLNVSHTKGLSPENGYKTCMNCS